MNEHATLEDIRKEIHIAAPVETVWSYLSEQEKMSAWMLTVTDAPEAGSGFAFVAPPPPDSEWDGRIECNVLEMNAPNHLRMTWTCNLLHHQETIVDIRLSANGEGTDLVLVHSGWDRIAPDISDERADHFIGWDEHLEIIEELATGKSTKSWMERKMSTAATAAE